MEGVSLGWFVFVVMIVNVSGLYCRNLKKMSKSRTHVKTNFTSPPKKNNQSQVLQIVIVSKIRRLLILMFLRIKREISILLSDPRSNSDLGQILTLDQILTPGQILTQVKFWSRSTLIPRSLKVMDWKPCQRVGWWLVLLSGHLTAVVKSFDPGRFYFWRRKFRSLLWPGVGEGRKTELTLGRVKLLFKLLAWNSKGFFEGSCEVKIACSLHKYYSKRKALEYLIPKQHSACTQSIAYRHWLHTIWNQNKQLKSFFPKTF